MSDEKISPEVLEIWWILIILIKMALILSSTDWRKEGTTSMASPFQQAGPMILIMLMMPKKKVGPPVSPKYSSYFGGAPNISWLLHVVSLDVISHWLSGMHIKYPWNLRLLVIKPIALENPPFSSMIFLATNLHLEGFSWIFHLLPHFFPYFPMIFLWFSH